MIAKKIKSSRTKSKASSIRHLADYIRQPTQVKPTEKILYSGGHGFVCADHESQKAEMIALASEAVRSKNPVNHYVLSWREGEQPNFEQVEEAVSIFMEELGLEGHQVIFGLHKDTDNLHLHLAVNRVHPETHKVIEINRGFDIEAVHKAIARIEHAQGWQSEKNARYRVTENGDLGREHFDPSKPRQPGQRQRDMENQTGEKSAERIAIEEAGPIIKRAKTWQQLHCELAEKGIRYEKTGSGATIFVGDIGVKASRADRSASLSKLERRLGPFQPPTAEHRRAERQPEPLKREVPGWDAYVAERKAHYAAKNAALQEQQKRQEDERKHLFDRQRQQRAEVLAGNWRGRGQLRNALASVLAAQQAAEKLVLKEQHQRERAALRQQYRPFPVLEQWQRLRLRPDLAEAWRHRDSEPRGMAGDHSEPPTPRDIRAFSHEIVGSQVHYSQAGGRGGGVSFADMGRRIDVHEWRDRDNVLAALQLSAQKWGRFEVTGNDEYKLLCAKLAARHGFKITNPELQESIGREREQIQVERAQAMKSDQLKLFERYADAVGADRYRVTSIKMRADGSKQTFILDKLDGVTRGFTPEEIEQRTPDMLRLQRRGENLYYTPLSDTKHHILIDDITTASLERLLQDGYQPAVILESSPGNYQVVITLPKLGTPHDRDVGNRLAERLNREFGDPKLSGAIHPHRAPGYQNRKPKHVREDGTYPEVRLIQAERRECERTANLAREIDADYQRQAAQRPARAEPRPAAHGEAPATGATGRTVEAYHRHYLDVIHLWRGGEINPSRVDSMIAVRLRMTGHTQAEIEGAIRQRAPRIRRSTDQGHNWADYAQRTARYAFSAAGDRQVDRLSRYREQWVEIEGRDQGDQEQEFKETVPRGLHP
jgi:hypothetical protein